MNHRFRFYVLALTLIAAIVAPIGTDALVLTSPGQYATNTVNDLVLMYYGTSSRKNWTIDELRPCVTHKFADGHRDWLFPGFLYLEFKMGKKQLVYGYTQENACREDWQKLIDKYFMSNMGFDALDKCIEKYKKELGEPPFRHKVVISIPSPIHNQSDWGKVNGRTLNFAKSDADRIQAVKWYIDELLSRFQKAHFKNFDLEGLYWVDENTHYCRTILPAVSDYVHSKKLLFYWIPYFNGTGSLDWKQMGFDIAYLQPNYFFRLQLGIERLYQTCERAKANGMGLEFEFDHKYFDTRDKHASRFTDYINVFEEQGVYANSAIAYYCDNHSLLDFEMSTRADDHRVMDRFASLIVERNRANAPMLTPQRSQSTNKGTNKSDNDYNWTDPEYWHF